VRPENTGEADPNLTYQGGPTICCQWDLATMMQEGRPDPTCSSQARMMAKILPGYVNQFKNELNYIR
jgi:hypothetical protein